MGEGTAPPLPHSWLHDHLPMNNPASVSIQTSNVPTLALSWGNRHAKNFEHFLKWTISSFLSLYWQLWPEATGKLGREESKDYGTEFSQSGNNQIASNIIPSELVSWKRVIWLPDTPEILLSCKRHFMAVTDHYLIVCQNVSVLCHVIITILIIGHF